MALLILCSALILSVPLVVLVLGDVSSDDWRVSEADFAATVVTGELWVATAPSLPFYHIRF